MWLTAEDVEEGLLRCQSRTSKLHALKTEIIVLTKIIGVKLDHHIFISKASLDDLKEYLLNLLAVKHDAGQQKLVVMVNDPSSLVGVQVNHTWTVNAPESHRSLNTIYHGHIRGVNGMEFDLRYD